MLEYYVQGGINMSNLETWIIQNYPDELMNALSLIDKDSKNNILFTNCESSFLLGGIYINSIKFDTILFSEDSKVLILLMKNGIVDKNDIIKYLDTNQINYNEVVFNKKYNDNEIPLYNEIPELWFCTSNIELENSLFHTEINFDSKYCVYYPNLSGSISLEYISTDNQKINMTRLKNKSAIVTCDKVILISKALSSDDIIKSIKKMGFRYYVCKDTKPNFVNKENMKNKIFQKRKNKSKILNLKANRFKK